MRPRNLLAILLSLLVISFAVSCEDRASVTVTNDIIVLIESPTQSRHVEGRRIEFVGSGSTSAGDVAEQDLKWTSSIDGEIGNGSAFTRDDLSPGVHEIELSAVNRDGQLFSDYITIEVYEREKRTKTAETKEKWFRRIKDPVDGGLYIEVYDGTVVDMSTGLMWEKSPDNALRSLKGAVEYAKNLRLGGHKGWRVPTVNELRMISNINFSPKYRQLFNISEQAVVHSAAICNVFDTMNGHFWAVDAANPYIMIGGKRYGHSIQYEFSSAVNYFRGTYKPYRRYRPGYVRCVRYADLNKWRRLLAKKN